MTIVAGRYRLEHKLGEGGFGSTWAAVEIATEHRVALKQLDVRRAKDWKSLELFEREAQVLRGLSHPAIPSYFDSFEAEDEDGAEGACFYLAQALAPGQALTDWVEDGWRPSGEELFELADQLLDVLIYLHELHPPVVHRDIKPHNILRDEHGAVSLVDFGSVKSTLDGDQTGGSTVVGTFGYMAPEQFRGHADPRTDLYGLGATLIYVMTHREPSALPSKKLTIDVRAVLPDKDEALLVWLETLLEADIADRFQDAREARDALERISRGEAISFEPSPRSDQSGESDAPSELLASEDEDETAEDSVEVIPLAQRPRMRPGDDGWEASISTLAPLGWIFFGVLLLGAIAAPLFVGLGGSIFAGVTIPFLALFFGVSLSPDTTANHPESQRIDSLASVIGCFSGALGQTIFACLMLVMFAETGAFIMVWSVIWALLYWAVGWLFAPTHNSFIYQQQLEEVLESEIPMPPEDRHLRLAIEEYVPGERASIKQHGSVNAMGWGLTGVIVAALGVFVNLGVPSIEGGLLPMIFGVTITLAALFSGIRSAVQAPSLELDANGLQARGKSGKHMIPRSEIVSHEIAVDTEEGGTTSHVQLWVTRAGASNPTLVYSLSEPSAEAAKLQAGILEEMTATIWEPERELVFDWRGEQENGEVILAADSEEAKAEAEERARAERWKQW